MITSAFWSSCTVPNIKSHKNPFRGSRVIACGRTDGRTDTLRS